MRRFLRRADRETPEWVRWLTPWGTSVALHAAGLLLLAILVTALSGDDLAVSKVSFAGQLGDDVLSSERGEQAGDPFTTLTTDEPPSLALNASAASDEVRLPKVPDSMTIGPMVNTPPSDLASLAPPSVGVTAAKPGRFTGKLKGEGNGAFDPRLPSMAPFSGRDVESRARMVRREGGTVESEKAVEIGLEWIARHQRPDGAWSLDTQPFCKGSPCPETSATVSDTAATGLALLPMLGAGHTHTKPGKYQKSLERGLFWLVKMQKPSGELYTGGGMHTLYYSHAIATMALCEGYGLTKDKRLRDPAQRAIFYINRSQNRRDGGWRYEFNQAGDTSVFGWQVFAMRSAHLGGLEVNRSVLKRARDFLDGVAMDSAGSTYAYMPGWAVSPSMTAEALVCRQLLGWPRNHPGMLQGTARVADHLRSSEQRNIYYWYYATQLLHNMRGKDWKEWNDRVREGLISMQVTGKGCDRGSWDPNEPQPDQWGTRGGRLYTTSLSLLTLEVYYRYLPLYRDAQEEMAGEDRDPDAGDLNVNGAAAR